MSDSKSVNVVFTWEGADYEPLQIKDKAKSLQEAIDFGIERLALCFTAEGGKTGRHFTNAWSFDGDPEVKSAADIITYLQRPFPPDERTLSRMFSRVSGHPAVKDDYSTLASVQTAISLLEKEPATARFITPCNGGYIKLEPSDTVYNREGQQVWPKPSAPSLKKNLSPRA